jgi:hypothetical protein
VNVATLGDDFSMLTGNLIALFFSPIITVVISFISPQNFDWKLLKERTEKMLIEDDIDEKDRVSHSVLLGLRDEDLVHHEAAVAATAAASAARDVETQDELTKVLMFSYWFGGGLSLILIIIWPLLALPQEVFTKSYWGWWVAIAFIWGHCASAITIVYPLYQVTVARIGSVMHVCAVSFLDACFTVLNRIELACCTGARPHRHRPWL